MGILKIALSSTGGGRLMVGRHGPRSRRGAATATVGMIGGDNWWPNDLPFQMPPRTTLEVLKAHR